MRIKHVVVSSMLGATLVLTGCADGGGPAAGSTEPGTTEPAATQTTPAESFNEADVTFAQQMIMHHRAAVAMADLAVERAQDDRVRQLARDIQSAQQPEIATMSGWLASWGEEVPSESPGMEGMDGMDDMSGGMTDEEMSRLMAASGREFDRTFLTMMIAHHEGAIEMARKHQTEGESPQAVALAKKIEADQTAEIALIRQLLKS